jgi:hypothetical protein
VQAVGDTFQYIQIRLDFFSDTGPADFGDDDRPLFL